MATYIGLLQWTEQGVLTFRDSPKRRAAGAELLQKLGGKLLDTHWTMGAYDVVITFEAPNDETAAAAMLMIAEGGAARTTTLRAFDEKEMLAIIDKTS